MRVFDKVQTCLWGASAVVWSSAAGKWMALGHTQHACICLAVAVASMTITLWRLER